MYFPILLVCLGVHAFNTLLIKQKMGHMLIILYRYSQIKSKQQKLEHMIVLYIYNSHKYLLLTLIDNKQQGLYIFLYMVLIGLVTSCSLQPQRSSNSRMSDSGGRTR